ncbi:MAG: hypothetical protein H6779_00995 [Candidatus Nomurabacteria bacterium]|nr:hypothetical protein [Candidatus Nomurabacteria bacterium]USN88007.1 MAG: hypothetical protein H6779_00995 [Candidatus Nomurabacteria bacterium]
MSNLKKWILYIPALILVFIYAGHAWGGLMQDPEFIELVGTLGFSEEITKYLVYLVFILDGAVVLLILFGSRITNLSWKFVYLWAGLWPWIPRYLEIQGGHESEWGEALFITILAFIAYKLHTTKNIKLFPKKEQYLYQ